MGRGVGLQNMGAESQKSGDGPAPPVRLACHAAGREQSETLFAVLSAFFIYAGNVSRGLASVVLRRDALPEKRSQT